MTPEDTDASIHPHSLVFRDPQRENAFLRVRYPKLRSRVALGLLVFLCHAVLSIVFVAIGNSAINSSVQGALTVQVVRSAAWFYTVLLTVAWVVFSTSPLSQCVSPELYERLTVFNACQAVLLCPMLDPFYVTKICGLDPQVILSDVSSDHALIFWLDVVVTGVHFVPLRWIVLLPIEIVSVFCYLVPALTLGGRQHTGFVFMNFTMLMLAVLTITMGKRDLEVLERRSFVQVALERTMRAEAEKRLHEAESLGLEVQLKQRSDAESSIVETTTTGQIFTFPQSTGRTCTVKEHMDKIIHLGLQEHWIVEHADVKIQTGSILGQGGFGLVANGLYHGAQVAVKTCKVSGDWMASNKRWAIAHELRIFRRLRHPNIILFYGAMIDPVNPDIALILEYVRGVSLDRAVGGPCLSVHGCEFRCGLLNDICCALSYLHSQKPAVIHGDLKDSNVLVERQGRSSRAKLLDFGLSRLLTPTAAKLGGTLRWMAPEVICGQEGALALSADIFSLGRLMYYIIGGLRPLSHVGQRDILERVRAGSCHELRWPEVVMLGALTKELVTLCTQFDPAARPRIVEVQSKLQAWPEVTHVALSAAISKAFPPRSFLDYAAGMSVVKSRSWGRHGGGGEEQATNNGQSAGTSNHTSRRAPLPSQSLTLLHPQHEETPERSRAISIFQMMLAWNMRKPAKSCCGLHAVIGEVQRLLDGTDFLSCYEMNPDNFQQCRQCKLFAMGAMDDNRECKICGFKAEGSDPQTFEAIPECPMAEADAGTEPGKARDHVAPADVVHRTAMSL